MDVVSVKIKIKIELLKLERECSSLRKEQFHCRRTIKNTLSPFIAQPLPKAANRSDFYRRSKHIVFFSARHGMSKRYSPIIISHKNITLKHLISVLGEYVQAQDEPDRENTNAPRALD